MRTLLRLDLSLPIYHNRSPFRRKFISSSTQFIFNYHISSGMSGLVCGSKSQGKFRLRPTSPIILQCVSFAENALTCFPITALKVLNNSQILSQRFAGASDNFCEINIGSFRALFHCSHSQCRVTRPSVSIHKSVYRLV